VSWTFDQKSQEKKPTYHPKEKTLPKPTQLTYRLVRYLTVILGHNPLWASRLKYVEGPRESGQNICNIRIFDQGIAREKGVSVTNFHTLDSHPELVIFEGWIDKNTGAMELDE